MLATKLGFGILSWKVNFVLLSNFLSLNLKQGDCKMKEIKKRVVKNDVKKEEKKTFYKEKMKDVKPRKVIGSIYICEYCKKRFNLRYSLKKHLRTHTGERPYSCKLCDASFTQSGGLKNHVVSKHQAEDVFICHHCKKEFPLKDRLKNHLQVHLEDKPFRCVDCNREFAHNKQLIVHMKVHSRQKPFNCTHCGAGFVCRSNLINHIKKHQGIENYICDICGKKFVRRDGLIKHMDFHMDRKSSHCKICNKSYKGHLKQHMRTHIKEKPHVCLHCNKRFVQRSQLTVHERVHSGIRPFRCLICHMAFSHSTALAMHIRRHTGEKPFKCQICPDKAFNQLPHMKKHMLTIHKTDKAYKCNGCGDFFKIKAELVEHENTCEMVDRQKEKGLINPPPMTLQKMRLLLACLFQKISSQEKLDALGYGKTLIDKVLSTSIKHSGREPCLEEGLDELTRLKKNIEILLEWTVPPTFLERFRKEHRTVEELLEELTS